VRVGVMINPDKSAGVAKAGELVSWLRSRGIGSLVTPETASLLEPQVPSADPAEWGDKVDFAVVLGGDGTLLRAAKLIRPYGTPLLGVNLGHLGFLTEVEVERLFAELPKFLRGKYRLEERHFIEAVVRGKKGTMAEYIALNDVVISKGPFARMLHLETFIDDTLVGTYPADGLVLSTATGSTAYSLSAGGPVVDPGLDVVIITPICPHTLYQRSLVTAPDQRIRVRLKGDPQETMITVDGQQGRRLSREEEVHASLSPLTVRFMRDQKWSFYEVLRKKLRRD